MARDHALALAGPADCAVLRVYRWSEPSVSLGRNEPALDRYDRSKLMESRLGVVRRPTGGRAVLHHRELTYALIAPLSGPRAPRCVYRRANRALVRALRALGTAAEMAGPPVSASRPDAGACFGRPAEHEVVVGGRKLVGSAQARFGRRVLQHGSVLLHDDQGLLGGLAADHQGNPQGLRAYDPPDAGSVALANLLPTPPSWEEVAEAVVAGFRMEWGGDWTGAEAERSLPSEVGILEEELRTRYASESWTWRR